MPLTGENMKRQGPKTDKQRQSRGGPLHFCITTTWKVGDDHYIIPKHPDYRAPAWVASASEMPLIKKDAANPAPSQAQFTHPPLIFLFEIIVGTVEFSVYALQIPFPVPGHCFATATNGEMRTFLPIFKPEHILFKSKLVKGPIISKTRTFQSNDLLFKQKQNLSAPVLLPPTGKLAQEAGQTSTSLLQRKMQ